MAIVPTPLAAGAATPWMQQGPSVLFLYGAGTALVEYTTEASAEPQWICSEEVAMGRAYPLDATAGGGCRVRITNKSDDPAAFAFAEDLRR